MGFSLQVPVQQVRNMSEHRTMAIKVSRYDWNHFKDLMVSELFIIFQQSGTVMPKIVDLFESLSIIAVSYLNISTVLDLR